MEGTVTLEIQEYNELYVKAVQGLERYQLTVSDSPPLPASDRC